MASTAENYGHAQQPECWLTGCRLPDECVRANGPQLVQHGDAVGVYLLAWQATSLSL
jgi:hypothetical protein